MSFHDSSGAAKELLNNARSAGLASAHKAELARVHAELAKAEAMYHLANAVGALVKVLEDRP